MENILENIEIIRKQKGIKQSVMAEKLGINQSAYSNIVTRNTDIPFGRLSQIADILGVSVVDIITYPKRYIDIDSVSVETNTGKVAVLFEVDPSCRDELIQMVSKHRK